MPPSVLASRLLYSTLITFNPNTRVENLNMQEQSKGHFALKYFVGRGIDVGAEQVCRIGDVISWDQDNRDAQTLQGIAHNSFNFCTTVIVSNIYTTLTKP